MTTASEHSNFSSSEPGSIMLGAIIGLIGGALIGLVESLKTLLTVFNAVLPASANSVDVLALLAGLFFLTTLYALAGAAGLGVLGLLLAFWQKFRRTAISTGRQVVIFSTTLVFVYTLFLTLDRLGIQELRSAGRGTALTWGLTLLGYSLFAAAIAWCVFSMAVDGWQQGRIPWLRRWRWSAARNLAVGLLIILALLPLTFFAFRQLNGSNPVGERSVRAASAASAERPNIIYITIDALRADHLGTYGYENAKTPNIDAFAAEGAVFEQANSQAPWTFPSFASQFTSLYPSDLNLSTDNRHISLMYSRFLDPSHVTMAEAIQAAGYRTQAIVTNPWLRPEFGFAQGFEGFTQVDDARMFHFSKMSDMSLVTVARQMPALYSLIRNAYTAITGNPGEPLVWDVRADRVTEEAVSWLRTNQDAPFFLWIHYVDPHYPFDPPPDFRPTVDNVTAERLAYLSSYNEEDVYTGRARLRPEDKAAIIELYDGEIAYTDLYMGKLFDEIDAMGLRDNSLVILSSDHGDEFWEHGGYQHGQSLYDELIRIPLIMRGPGIQPGSRLAADVQHIDLLPTLVAVAGGTIPKEVKGRSLLPVLQATSGSEEVYNFAEALFLTEEKKTVRGQGYKLIYAPYSQQVELYDLRNDPGEQQNLADSDPAQAERLERELQTWLESTGSALGDPQPASSGGTDPSMLQELIED